MSDKDDVPISQWVRERLPKTPIGEMAIADLRSALSKAQQQLDELAAQNERLREALSQLTWVGPTPCCDLSRRGHRGGCPGKIRDDALSLPSPTALEELKQRVRSEAIGTPSGTTPWVLAFARLMEAKLDKNRHKGDREGWRKDSPRALYRRLLEETRELDDALSGNNRIEVGQEALDAAIWEAVDVANFAMMIADQLGGLEPKS